MTEQKRPRGRPKSDNPASKKLPAVRVTPEELSRYKEASVKANLSLSEWIRAALDKASGFDKKKKKN